MKKAKSILMAASLLLAMAFTFSCSTIEGNLDSSGISSSGDGGSSSSEAQNNGTSSSATVGTSGTFEDSRDSKIYKWVKIGTQIWMAENLNYEAEGGKCYGEGGYPSYIWDPEIDGWNNTILSDTEVQANCAKYGRLYDWLTAMNCDGFSGCSAYSVRVNYRGICPEGWHIPTYAEWDVLFSYAEEGFQDAYSRTYPTAGKHLAATTGWFDGVSLDMLIESGITSYGGLDTYGFTALPGNTGRNEASNNPSISFGSLQFFATWHSIYYESEGPYFAELNFAQTATQFGSGPDTHYIMASIRCIQN